MSGTAQAVVLTIFALSASVWVGGYVAIVVVTRSAVTTLDQESRVRFFRSLGRSYLLVGAPALAIALVTGAILLRDHARDPLLVVTAVVAIVLVVLLAFGVAQARRMTRLRRQALEAGSDESLAAQIARGGRAAGILRGFLGLLTLALVVLGAFLAA